VKGFLLQLVNVKVFLFGLTALTGFVVEYGKSLPFLLTFGSIVAGMGILATATWIGLGALIQKFYRKHYRILNIIMALTLLECIVSMFR
jgi:cysteine/O-acetylserine efflux protein